MAWVTWNRCFKKNFQKAPPQREKKPLKSGFPFQIPSSILQKNRVKLPLIGSVKFHKQEIPKGKIKCGRMIKRASVWYLCLFINAHPKAIKTAQTKKIGIDPGFTTHLMTTDDELSEYFKKTCKKRGKEIELRLAQAQIGKSLGVHRV